MTKQYTNSWQTWYMVLSPTYTQLSQNRPNPNFDEHEQTSYFHFFGILEVPKTMFRKYSIGGPFRKLGAKLYLLIFQAVVFSK